jgi:hypothetical protein
VRGRAGWSAMGSEAQVLLGLYRDEYDNHRPHGCLGQKTPAEMYAGTRTNADRGEASKRVAGRATKGGYRWASGLDGCGSAAP